MCITLWILFASIGGAEDLSGDSTQKKCDGTQHYADNNGSWS